MFSQIILKLKTSVAPLSQTDENLNINQIFKPFYYLLSIFGMFPYSVSYNNSKNSYKQIPNSIYINIVCAFIYMILMLTFCFIHIQGLFQSDDKLNNTLSDVLITQLNYILEICILVGFAMIAYISSFSNRFRYIKILNGILSVWADSKNKNRYDLLRRLNFQINFVTMGCVVGTTVVQLAVNATRDEGPWKVILVAFSAVLPSVLQTILVAFHYIFVTMMVTILSDIEQQISNLSKPKTSSDAFFVKVEVKSPTYSLKHLELIYMKAYEIKEEINLAFQGPLLCVALQTFHCIVSEAYNIYHRIMEHKCTIHNIINCTTWIVIPLLKIYSLAYSGNLLNNQAVQLGQKLHYIPTEGQDHRMMMKVQHFSTLMYFYKFTLTVYGYFPLSAPLVSAMIANVTMYLIILIQFDKSNSTSSIPSTA